MTLSTAPAALHEVAKFLENLVHYPDPNPIPGYAEELRVIAQLIEDRK